MLSYSAGRARVKFLRTLDEIRYLQEFPLKCLCSKEASKPRLMCVTGSQMAVKLDF